MFISFCFATMHLVSAAPSFDVHFASLNRALADSDAAWLEKALSFGLSTPDAVNELASRSESKDYAYLSSLANSTPDERVQIRAIERVASGYRATLNDGRIATMTFQPGGDVFLNQDRVGSISDSAKLLFPKFARALSRKEARASWSVNLVPRALAAPKLSGEGAIVLSVALLMKAGERRFSDAISPKLTEVFSKMVGGCRKFLASATEAKLKHWQDNLGIMKEHFGVDFGAQSVTAANCAGEVERTLQQKWKLSVPANRRIELRKTCGRAVELAACFREVSGKMKGSVTEPAAETSGVAR